MPYRRFSEVISLTLVLVFISLAFFVPEAASSMRWPRFKASRDSGAGSASRRTSSSTACSDRSDPPQLRRASRAQVRRARRSESEPASAGSWPPGPPRSSWRAARRSSPGCPTRISPSSPSFFSRFGIGRLSCSSLCWPVCRLCQTSLWKPL